MNKPIRRVSVFCLVLVLALMIRVNWVQGVDAASLNNNTNNKRGIIAGASYPRGNIIVGGQAITKSVEVNGDLYKYQEAFTNGAMYAPITGYFSNVFGSSLLESVENPVLSGTAPDLAVNNFEALITGKQKQGGDVVTTLDPKVQAAGYQGLTSKGFTGAAVALDPTTGAILAAVSAPSYDPGSFSGTDPASAAAWAKLTANPNSPENVMLNRALRVTYPPGSTFKLITSAAALETGKVTDINAATDSPNPYLLPGTTTELTNESASDPCTNATLTEALTVSCNTVFAKLGAEIGDVRMAQEAAKFGFNSTLDMPIRVAQSTFATGINVPQTALSSIGQFDTAATPMQMAMVASAIADNGVLMTPYLVASERAANTSVIGTPTQPKVMSQATTATVAQQIQTMMENVVATGTGVTAQIPGVTVGGKTGTAQNGVNNSGNPYAWFVSFAKNSSGKEIAVAVVVANSSTDRSDISGEELAAPIAKKMMEAYVGQ